jgi:heat shock protein HtpX
VSKPELLERRNRARISALLVLATLNYMLAIALAAVAVVLGIVLALIFNLDVFPDDADTFRWFVIGIGAALALAFPVGLVIALIKIPFARRSLERRVLRETGARIAETDQHRELRNLLDGLAIAGGIPVPRFAVIEDPAPNSFGVGTRPKNTIVGVTTGLSDVLSRDELEAVMAYEVSRIRSWDVALASWTVALTSGAISAAESNDDMLRSFFGWLPRKFGEWLQVWALRGQGVERDRAAVRFTRNPKSLIRALEKLDADPRNVGRVSRATAPLWVEFPAGVLKGSTKSTRRLAGELLLDERIDALRELAGMGPRETQAGATSPTS